MTNRTLTIIPAKLSNLPAIDRPIRIAAYCRVSSPSEEQALSLETQIQYYTDKIAFFPFGKNAGVFADTATGRNIKQRPAFKKLMTKCRAGKVDLILTKSISRFGRNSLETIRALRELRSRGVDVYFERDIVQWLIKEKVNNKVFNNFTAKVRGIGLAYNGSYEYALELDDRVNGH